MKELEVHEAGGWLQFGSGDDVYSMPNPVAKTLADMRWRLRYRQVDLKSGDLLHIAAVVDAYVHLATHPSGTERCLAQLRRLRAWVKRTAKGDRLMLKAKPQ